MTAPTLMEMDLIEELRHRRWARENYVTAADRDRTWHPIVLDEMRRRDGELRELRLDRGPTPIAPHAFAPALAGTQLGTQRESTVASAVTR